MGSRSDNRLESVANAHTAADLRVRPVSKTALVSKSWTPRALQEIHDARFLAMRLIGGTTSPICCCSIETARRESKFLNQRKESRVS
jgi:hypothetical protein